MKSLLLQLENISQIQFQKFLFMKQEDTSGDEFLGLQTLVEFKSK